MGDLTRLCVKRVVHQSPAAEPTSAEQSLREDPGPPSPLPPDGPQSWSLDDAQSCTAAYDTDHTVTHIPKSCHDRQAQNYLNAGAVFVKWPFKGARGALGPWACSHARHLEVHWMRMHFPGLVVLRKCGTNGVNWLQISSCQILRAPASPHCWAAIWTPSSVLQKRIKWENDLRLLWLSIHTPEAIM